PPRQHSFSRYCAQQILFADWLRFEGGMRGDFFVFDVNDRLPRQRRDPNFSAVFLNGHTSEGQASPKANLTITPLENTEIYLNFGQGFHSNDARANITGQFSGQRASGTGVEVAGRATPLARATGYEIGPRPRLFDHIAPAPAVWNLKLGSELVFSGDAGPDEPSGASSRRYGVDFEARWQINDWLYADYDLSWVHARFDNGGFVPLAPPILMNGGLTADFHNGFTVGLRGRYLTDRPADEDNRLQAEGYYLIDIFRIVQWRHRE